MYKFILRIYFAIRTSWFIWFYFINRKSRILFQKNIPKLDAIQARILKELTKTGIARTTLDELFQGENKLYILKEYTSYLYDNNDNIQTTERKKFLKDLWDPTAPLDFTNPFIKLALNRKLLDIVNSYMRMWTKLMYAALQITVPVQEGSPAQASQRWHRDPQEKRMCKVFIYLNDVDEDAGPFIYIPGSTFGNKYGRLFPQRSPEGIYPPEGAVEKVIPPNDIKVQTGKAGTVIFCDTSGLHRGGYATQKERIMFTAFFAAPSFKEKVWYKLPDNLDEIAKNLDEAAKFALTNPKT